MTKWLERTWMPYFAKKGIVTDGEMCLHLMLLAADFYAAVMHLAMLVFGIVTNFQELTIINAVSLALYLIGFIKIVRRRYYRAGILLSLEVFLYTAWWSFCFGVGYSTVFYLLMVMVMQVLIPYAKAWRRVEIVLLLWLCVLASVIFGNLIEPYGSLGEYEAAVNAFNLNAGIIGILFAILIENSIKRAIAAIIVKRMRQIETLAHTDQLTGLYNRRYAEILFQRLRAERREGNTKKRCVAMLDIDDFKKVNDTYGHAVGDTILRFLSVFLKEHLRKGDLVFRWGGEEFLVFLESPECRTAALVMDKIRSELANTPINTEAGSVSVTVTIGVAELQVEDISGGIGVSDQRLYNGKQRGKNRVVWQ